MNEALNSQHKETLLSLLNQAHTVLLRLQDMEEELLLDSDAQAEIQGCIFKAHDLLVMLGKQLID